MANYLNQTEIAKQLNVNRSYIQKLAAIGRIIPAGTKGKTLLYDIEAVKKELSNKRTNHKSKIKIDIDDGDGATLHELQKEHERLKIALKKLEYDTKKIL